MRFQIILIQKKGYISRPSPPPLLFIRTFGI